MLVNSRKMSSSFGKPRPGSGSGTRGWSNPFRLASSFGSKSKASAKSNTNSSTNANPNAKPKRRSSGGDVKPGGGFLKGNPLAVQVARKRAKLLTVPDDRERRKRKSLSKLKEHDPNSRIQQPQLQRHSRWLTKPVKDGDNDTPSKAANKEDAPQDTVRL